MIRISLRIKILVAILTAMIISNGLTMWAVQDRLLVSAQREATRQASAQTAQVHALYGICSGIGESSKHGAC